MRQTPTPTYAPDGSFGGYRPEPGRFDGIRRDYTPADVAKLSGSFRIEHTLADMGARVIKVERPGQGDLFRTLTFNNRWLGGSESPNFLAWNRNKRSLALDLKAPEAKTVLYRIAETADVVVQNFRPGVIERMGLGEDILTAPPRDK